MEKKELEWYEEGGSGKLDNKVYYKLKGKTYVRKAPVSHNVIPTAQQAPVRERFIAAHRFAQSVIANPVLKALYLKKANGKCNAYSKAVSAFMLGEV